MYHILKIHSIDGHLGYFHFLVIMNNNGCELFFWLCWVFIVVCGSFVAACRLLSSCGVQAQYLRQTGSLVAVLGLSCPAACGILVPRQGIEPMSPALEGGFLTTGPPGKPPDMNFCVQVFT